MKKNTEENENKGNLLQLGQIDSEVCKIFRRQSIDRKLKQVEILTLLVKWWISLDEMSQRKYYFGDEPIPAGNSPLLVDKPDARKTLSRVQARLPGQDNIPTQKTKERG